MEIELKGMSGINIPRHDPTDDKVTIYMGKMVLTLTIVEATELYQKLTAALAPNKPTGN